jgi:hypothetical protein
MADQDTVWEYNVIQLPYNVKARTEALNKLARDRWELVTVTHEGTVSFGYLRRRVQQPQPESQQSTG